MTIADAIRQLQHLQQKHGDVNVYLDCPFCGNAYAPDVVKPVAIHMTSTLRNSLGLKTEKEGSTP